MRRTILWCFLFTLVSLSDAYRILGVFPYQGKSHNVMYEALARGIAEQGHEIDVITHHPLKNPPKTYKVAVDLNGTMPNVVNTYTIDHVLSYKGLGTAIIVERYGNRVCQLMGLEVMQSFIKKLRNSPAYDLVIVEAFTANCYMGFGILMDVPVVAVSSAIEYPWISSFIGNDDNVAYVPTPAMTIFTKMNFWQRLQNFYSYHSEKYTFETITGENQTAAMREYLKSDMPNIREVEKNVALTLVNSQLPIFGVKPVSPSLVYVGGLHVGHGDKKLPQDLQKWLDESKDGFIYFSFGSMVLIESLPLETLKIIYDSFSKIKPVRVLMKVPNKSKLPPGLPSNIFTYPWIPQEAVLAHNNTRAFITHGGLMGSQEALYYGIPMIGIPLFSDQPANVAAFVAKNMTIKLDIRNITSASLDYALDAVLNDPKYWNYAKHYSKLFRDRPMTAMETAMFWIEYTIRNGPVLRSPALELSWLELNQLDIYGFFLLIIILLLIIMYYCLKFLVHLCSNRSSKKLKKN